MVYLDIYDSIGGLPVIGISYGDKEAKVVNVLNQPDIRENLNYVYTWYNEGLIDPNAPTIASLPKYKIVYSQQGFEGANTIWSMQDGYNVVSNKLWGPFYSTRIIQGSLNTVFAVSPNPSNQWELVRKQNETASTSPIIGFTFDESNVRDELINCKAPYESYKSQVLTGVREELNTILYDNGLQKIIDEAQSQVDKFLNK